MKNRIPCNAKWFVLIKFDDMPDDADEASIRQYIKTVQAATMTDLVTSIEYVGVKNPLPWYRRIFNGR